jgi:hypothetical protein
MSKNFQNAKQVRLTQGGETNEFLGIFGGKFIVLFGESEKKIVSNVLRKKLSFFSIFKIL